MHYLLYVFYKITFLDVIHCDSETISPRNTFFNLLFYFHKTLQSKEVSITKVQLLLRKNVCIDTDVVHLKFNSMQMCALVHYI